jgi:hypothetical protein
MSRNEPPSADEEVAKLRLQLRDKSLEELVDEGLVTWDRENNVVMKGPHFDRERPLKR